MCTHTSKIKQGINLLLLMGRQAFRHLQESKAPSCITLTWGTNAIILNIPSSYFSQLYMMSMMPHGMGIFLLSAVVSCPDCVPFQVLCTPSLLTDGMIGKAEKALTLYTEHCSEITNLSLCY